MASMDLSLTDEVHEGPRNVVENRSETGGREGDVEDEVDGCSTFQNHQLTMARQEPARRTVNLGREQEFEEAVSKTRYIAEVL